jgi:hypothetical protein
MATTKIHCDYFEIYNIDWANLSPRQVNRLIEVIQNMELVGDPPNLHGFVGVQRLETFTKISESTTTETSITKLNKMHRRKEFYSFYWHGRENS